MISDGKLLPVLQTVDIFEISGILPGMPGMNRDNIILHGRLDHENHPERKGNKGPMLLLNGIKRVKFAL